MSQHVLRIGGREYQAEVKAIRGTGDPIAGSVQQKRKTRPGLALLNLQFTQKELVEQRCIQGRGSLRRFA